MTEVRWWERPDFTEREVLEAAELVAFDLFEPALRSRGGMTERAKQLYGNHRFVEAMRQQLRAEPAGRLIIPTLADAMERIAALERRLSALETQLRAG